MSNINNTTTMRDSAVMRWSALLLLAVAMFFAYIFMDILSPIKDLMESTRGWDSTAFGTYAGSETFLNVFIFFLIIAGIILDKMGVRFTALLSGAVMLLGACINWYAITEMFMGSALEEWFKTHLNYIPVFDELGVSPFYEGMPASAKFASIGFMIFGCGAEMAGITVSRGVVKWFKGNGVRNGISTPWCGYMYDFLACICKDVWQSRRISFCSIRSYSFDDCMYYVCCIFLYGQTTRCSNR